MSLFKSKSKNEDFDEIKEIINNNIATAMKTQRPFSQLLMLNGCPMRKVGSIGNKIRKQLLNEAKDGDLTVDQVMPRTYSLIGEYLDITDVKTFEDLNVELENEAIESTNQKLEAIRKNGFNATLPYISSGVTLGQAGRNSFGGATYLSSQFGEGQTDWKNSKVFFVENGLRIDETEQFIHYKQVDYVDYSTNADRKGLLALKRSAITFVMKNGDQIIMRVVANELDLIKHWIEFDMENIRQTNEANNTNDEGDDVLIKYYDMFEKGLITREEFMAKKEQLSQNNNENTSSNNDAPKGSYCGNCGSLVYDDSNFCTNCGNKLN